MKLAKVFKENKQFTLFSILALVVVGVAVFAPQIAPYDPLDAVMLESLQAPSSAHPFGTDKLGRDLLSRGRCDHAYRRYDDLFPRSGACNRNRRYAGTKPCECRYLHCSGKLDQICPSCTKHGTESKEEPLY